MKFKRGQSPKIALGLGKYGHLKKWWDDILEEEKTKLPDEYPKPLLSTVTSKLVFELRKYTKNSSWAWGTTDMNQASFQVTKQLQGKNEVRVCINIRMSSKVNQGDFYVYNENYFNGKQTRAGNMGLDPYELLKNINIFADTLYLIAEKKLRALQKREHMGQIIKVIDNLFDAGIRDPNIVDGILAEGSVLLKNLYDED